MHSAWRRKSQTHVICGLKVEHCRETDILHTMHIPTIQAMYVYRQINACSWNRCCSGRAVSV